MNHVKTALYFYVSIVACLVTITPTTDGQCPASFAVSVSNGARYYLSSVSISIVDHNHEGLSHASDACPSDCPGDVTGDGILDGRDVVQFTALQFSPNPTPAELCAGDFNLDNEIDPDDSPGFSQAILLGLCRSSVSIIQNGIVVPHPAYPYEMEGYSEGDLPALRTFASDNGIFAGIDINADWKDREWLMIQAIVRWLATHTRWSATGANSATPSPPRAIGNLDLLNSGGRLIAWGNDDEYGNVESISNLPAENNRGFVAVASGRNFCMALRDTGAVEHWGKDIVAEAIAPKPMPGDLTGYIGIAAGDSHALVLRADGSVESWGENASGQCDVSSPNNDFVAVAGGIKFSVGLKKDGTVVVWGNLPSDVSLNASWQGHFIKVAAGGYHCVGLLDDGATVAWGSNNYGQCIVPHSFYGTPIQDRVIDVAADKYRSYATIDFYPGFFSWGLTLSNPGTGGYSNVWTSPTQKYVLAAKDQVPAVLGLYDAPIPAPSRSQYTAIAYDKLRKVVLKFGGTLSDGVGKTNEIVEWDGREWDKKFSAVNPEARHRHAMAYDALRNVSVLWGEAPSGGFTRDAWEWNGVAWAGPYATSGTRPDAYLGCAMVYDPGRGPSPAGRVVLFGGATASSYVATAYDYDPETHTWSVHAIGNNPNPGARASQGFAYDSARDKLIIFGGFNGSSALNDTREAPAGGTGTTQFALITPSTTTPAARYEHAMVYDSARGVTVLYGGRSGSTYYNETWEWDGVDWVLKTPAHNPGTRARHAMTFDSERRVVVLFGGLQLVPNGGIVNDTWEYDGTDWTFRNDRLIPVGTIPTPDAGLVYAGFAPADRFILALTDYMFSCGTLARMDIGLCVAHGIAARPIQGVSSACEGDGALEIFSTQWNKWIMFWQIPGYWMEDANGVPVSHAEIRAHHAARDYSLGVGYALEIGKRGWRATPENGSGIVFKPNAIPVPLRYPRVPGTFWSETLKLNPVSPGDDHDKMELNLTDSIVRFNNPVPQSNHILFDDFTQADLDCGYHLSGHPLSSDTDINLTYPLNNVHAEAELVEPTRIRITLTHNMVAETGGFDHYEMSLDDGHNWTMLNLENEADGVYIWYPPFHSAMLMIRGVNAAGLHSPDIAINFTYVAAHA